MHCNLYPRDSLMGNTVASGYSAQHACFILSCNPPYLIFKYIFAFGLQFTNLTSQSHSCSSSVLEGALTGSQKSVQGGVDVLDNGPIPVTIVLRDLHLHVYRAQFSILPHAAVDGIIECSLKRSLHTDRSGSFACVCALSVRSTS